MHGLKAVSRALRATQENYRGRVGSKSVLNIFFNLLLPTQSMLCGGPYRHPLAIRTKYFYSSVIGIKLLKRN